MTTANLIIGYLWKAVYLAVAVAACVLLVRWVPGWAAILIWTAFTAAACFGVSALLMKAQTGEVTWRNRLAGFTLAWASLVGGGRLWPITTLSWAVWTAIGVAAVLISGGLGIHFGSDAAPAAVVASTQPAAGTFWTTVVRGLLFVTWFVYGGFMIYAASTLAANFTVGSTSGRSLLKVIAIAAALLAGSIVLYSTGRPEMALVVTGTPIAIVAAFFGLFAGTIVVLGLLGKPIRWN